MSGYEESLGVFDKFAARVEVLTGDNREWCAGNTHRTLLVFRREGERVEWRGTNETFGRDGQRVPAGCFLESRVFDGARMIRLYNTNPELDLQPYRAGIFYEYAEERAKLLDATRFGGPLFGRHGGSNHKGIGELLRESGVEVAGAEMVSGVQCQVIEGVTRYGKVLVWIAPGRGHVAMKWTVVKGSSDLFDERRLADIGLRSWEAVFEATHVEVVSGVDVVCEGRYVLRIVSTEGKETVDESVLRMSAIELDPNLEESGAFEIDLPEGTIIHDEKDPNTRYVWHDSRIIEDVGDYVPSDPAAYVGEHGATVRLVNFDGTAAAGKRYELRYWAPYYWWQAGEGEADSEGRLRIGGVRGGEDAVPIVVEVEDGVAGIFGFALEGEAEERELEFRLWPLVGAVAPEIVGVDVFSGGEVRLSDLRGQVVVLEFWATWCGPCQGAMVEFCGLAGRRPEWEGKVAFVGVSVDDLREKAAGHVRERGWTGVRQWWCEGGWEAAAMGAYGVTGVPMAFLIDGEGRIVRRGGYGEAEIERVLRAGVTGR